ncbi:MAG: NGG1p interacting factor NIF3 [Pseudomonadota bacterium]
MYKICFYVPENFADVVKNAMFEAGAGKHGNYSNTSWQTLGEGQFLPQPGSDPYTGNIENLEKIPELKVEMICEDAVINKAIAALKASHPYEQPSYQAWLLTTI